ncbi:MAG: M48 family metalloprotease [bacterium]
MSRRPGARLAVLRLLVALFLAFSAGCVMPPLQPLGAERTAEDLEVDEAALWKQTRQVQFEVESSGLVLEDETLDAYLESVLQRVTPAELRTAGLAPRVQVISDVRIHGYSFANGVIYLHTALLSRMQDETQLATVLTRELAHVIHRHTLRLKRDEKVRADVMAWLGVGASISDYGGNVKLLAQAFSVSSALGFPYALEVTADEEGLALLAAAGYDVREAPDFFQGTVDYLAEIHTQGPAAWLPFAAPAPMTARIAGYRKIIAADYTDYTDSGGQAAADGGAHPLRPPIADPPTFRRKVQAATLRQAELELSAGLFVSAEKTARLAIGSSPRDPTCWLLLGRALQGQRNQPIKGRPVPPIKSLRETYARILEIDPTRPAALRELGLTYYQTTARRRPRESSRQALDYFRRYLAAAPRAPDADYIRAYLGELEEELAE